MDKFSDMTLFVSIVKHQGLAAAGRELGLSPATVTARLQAIEERYGVKLLNRSTRHVNRFVSVKRSASNLMANISHSKTMSQWLR